MKVVVSILVVMLCAGSGVLAEQARAAKISANEVRYDAGRVKRGQQVIHVFEITNVGTAPLVLERVQPS
jgi:hypothetical protein